jgi:hypothetical protein
MKKSNKIVNTKNSTHMNIICSQLLKRHPNVEETYGYITKIQRQKLNLTKEHYFDAVAIASQFNNVNFISNIGFLKRSNSKGEYTQKLGLPISKKIFGFRRFDKIKYNNNEYFIKGRQSIGKGYYYLMDITGKQIKFKSLPKTSLITKISARKTWMIQKIGVI